MNSQIILQITNLHEVRQDKKLMRTLYALTLRGYSEMRAQMHSIYGDYATKCKIIIAKSDKKIIGWALMYPYPGGWAACFYVARAFRRRKIGTILYNKAKELCGKNMFCSSWDKASAGFFIKNKAKIYTTREVWQDTTLLNQTGIYLD